MKENTGKRIRKPERNRLKALKPMNDVLQSGLHDSVEEDGEENAAVQAARAGKRTVESLGKTASSAYQRRKIKREYAAAKAEQMAHTPAEKAAEQIFRTAEPLDEKIRHLLQKGKGWIAVVMLAMMLLYILNTFSACTPIV